MDSLFFFSRTIFAEAGSQSQTVAVYASDLESAQIVLESELANLRQGEGSTNPANLDIPPWSSHQVSLDTPKVVSFVVTG